MDNVHKTFSHIKDRSVLTTKSNLKVTAPAQIIIEYRAVLRIQKVSFS